MVLFSFKFDVDFSAQLRIGISGQSYLVGSEIQLVKMDNLQVTIGHMAVD